MTHSRRLVWLTLVCLTVAACSPSPFGSPDPSAIPTRIALATPTPTPEPTPGPTPTPAVPAGALLPNLVMEPLDEWHIEYREGRRLLRMTTVFANIGDGPFELSGDRPRPVSESIVLSQIVYLDSGGSLLFPTAVDARYAGDDHDHWHAQKVVTLQLSPIDEPASVRNGVKVHFCFFDDVRAHPELIGPVKTAQYLRAWCAGPDASSIRMGLSLGWGDRYGWDFAFQWIDITELTGGTYLVKATVDLANDFHETDDTDNCTMSRIYVPVAGAGQIVTVLGSGEACPN